MPTVYLLVGIPASGKSTWTKMNAEKLNAHVLSSDDLREVLYGDVNNQDNNTDLFQFIYKQAKLMLDLGLNVIIDSTNTSRKRRISFNREFKNYTRKAIYFNSSANACIIRDRYRERKVGSEVITRMYKNLQVPTYSEGWDSIEIIYDKLITPFNTKEGLEKKILNEWSYDEMFGFPYGLGEFNDFMRIYNLPQDNPNHSFSVSRHTYHVYHYVYNNYKNTETVTVRDFLKMLWFAILHDVGKGYTKTFINYKGNPSRYAHFYQHENCSGQIACSILHTLGYDDKFILEVVELVQLHMRLYNADTEKSKNKLKKEVGEDVYVKLEFFQKADISAK